MYFIFHMTSLSALPPVACLQFPQAPLTTNELTVLYRSLSLNNKSEDQFGEQEQEMWEGCVQGELGIIDENSVVGNGLGHRSL